MPIANLIASDGHIVPKASPMGRQVAGEQFIRAFISNSQTKKLFFSCPSDDEAKWIGQQVSTYRPRANWEHYPLSEWQMAAQQAGSFHFPDPALNHWSWARMPYGDSSFSLLGIVHTLSSKAIQKAIGEYLTSPIRDWDALICTSKAARDVVSEFLERQKEWLQSKTGAQRFEAPQLPVIPLGIDTSEWEPKISKKTSQQQARDLLGLNQDSVIVLMAGRLDILTKYKPEAALRCLEKIKRESSSNLEVLIYGESPNQDMLRRWHEGAKEIAPNLKIHWIEGKKRNLAAAVRWAADIFLSLADNFQETFGITPLEAMASELPCVVTDWNGYRDTVVTASESRDPTGFRIKTTIVEGLGETEACQLLNGSMDYSIAVGRLSQGVSLDLEELETSLIKLLKSPDLRRWMGANGLKRVKNLFNWRTIIRSWEELDSELSKRRQNSIKNHLHTPPHMPHWMPTYSSSFGQFATRIISKTWQPDIPAEVEQLHFLDNAFNDWDLDLLHEKGSPRHLGWCIKQGLLISPQSSLLYFKEQ